MSGEPTLQKGDSGEWVGHLQELMRDARYWQGDANDSFDDDLEQAVQALQDSLNLPQTGVVDDDTWSALDQQTRSTQQPARADGSVGTGHASAASMGYDAEAWTWTAFLARNGPRWNGEDTAWDQFSTWFAYEAGQQGLADPATGFLTYVESQSDRIAAFAAHGVSIASSTNAGDGTAAEPSQVPDTSTFPLTKLGDSGDWVAYLDAILTSHGF